MCASIAEAKNADMIVLGSRGFGNLNGLLLGSVAPKVVAHAGCTCVTMREWIESNIWYPCDGFARLSGKARDTPWCCAPQVACNEVRRARKAAQLGPFFCLLGTSAMLDDATASPVQAFLPRKQKNGSQGYHMFDLIH